MKIGDKCTYKADHNNVGCWKNGIILDIKGPFSAKVYTIAGVGTASGELVTKTSHYVMEMK